MPDDKLYLREWPHGHITGPQRLQPSDPPWSQKYPQPAAKNVLTWDDAEKALRAGGFIAAANWLSARNV